MKASNIPANLSKENVSVSSELKKGSAIKKILAVVQITAIIWSSLVLVTYLSIPCGLFDLLTDSIRNICANALYFGICGAPIVSLLTLPLYIIYVFRTNGKEISNNRKMFFVALFMPIIITLIIMFFEFNVYEFLA